eukprot:365110-Chlamydomonas_euryale.AAC.2
MLRASDFEDPVHPPSIHPSIRPSIHSFIHPSYRPVIYSDIHPTTRPSVCPSIHACMRPSLPFSLPAFWIHPSIHTHHHPHELAHDTEAAWSVYTCGAHTSYSINSELVCSMPPRLKLCQEQQYLDSGWPRQSVFPSMLDATFTLK